MKMRLLDLTKLTNLTMVAVAATTLAVSSGNVLAQSAANFPSKPITLIIPYTPGSTNDIEARI